MVVFECGEAVGVEEEGGLGQFTAAGHCFGWFTLVPTWALRLGYGARWVVIPILSVQMVVLHHLCWTSNWQREGAGGWPAVHGEGLGRPGWLYFMVRERRPVAGRKSFVKGVCAVRQP